MGRVYNVPCILNSECVQSAQSTEGAACRECAADKECVQSVESVQTERSVQTLHSQWALPTEGKACTERPPPYIYGVYWVQRGYRLPFVYTIVQRVETEWTQSGSKCHWTHNGYRSGTACGIIRYQVYTQWAAKAEACRAERVYQVQIAERSMHRECSHSMIVHY